MKKDRNKRPQEGSKNLPMAVLITLVAIVCLLLYVGWQMISDEPSKISDLTTPQATVIREANPNEIILEEETVPLTNNDVSITVAIIDPDVKTASHTVSKGETFFSIASRYNLTVSTLQSYNSAKSASSLSVGAKLMVPVLAIHTVGAGDILRVVGGKYGITVDAIMKANGKTQNRSARGEKLIIPFKEKK